MASLSESELTVKTYACVYLGSALVAIVGTPIAIRLAKVWGLVDAPGVRKVHKSPIPRVGGIAIVAAMLALVIPVLILNNDIGQAFRKIQAKVIILLVAAVFVFAVGLIDDIRGLRAKLKLLCLAGAALAVCASGSRIDSVGLGSMFEWELGWASWPITVLWIVGVTVALNFMDGLDGLAAGIAAIVCAVIVVFAFYQGQLVMAVLMLALLGSLTGFLFYNFNPAKIFMGDCGSMFLGFVIGGGSVVCAAKKSTLVGIALPALALGVPILDALFTMIRRGILDRRSIFTAERGHIHHRLLDKGLRHRNVVLLIYAATLLTAGMAMCLLITQSAAILVVFLSALAFLLLLFHCVGSARLGETVKAIRRNSAIARKAREDKSNFEDAQLAAREAETFETWWQTVTGLAEKMEFDRLAFTVQDNGSSAYATVWRRTEEKLTPRQVLQLTIPVGGGNGDLVSWFELSVRPNGSLEAVGRRLMYFGRMIDEFGTGTRWARRSGLAVLGAGSYQARLPRAGGGEDAPSPVRPPRRVMGK